MSALSLKTRVGDIDSLILEVRGQKVVVDSDLARIYGVPTFRFNEAVKRNSTRFPPDFMFRLTEDEWIGMQTLRSQIAILKNWAWPPSQIPAPRLHRARCHHGRQCP